MTTARLGLLAIATAIQAVTCCLADTYGLPPPMQFEWELKLGKTALKESTPVVFRSQDEWAQFWKQQDPQRKEAPQVDFANQMVAGKETVMIYRVELDDASGPKELLVRMASEDALDLGRSVTPSGTRLHLVTVPRSALPVRFVKDDMVDGRGYGAYPEGVKRTDLGLIAGLAKPEESGKAVYREQAEKLVRDQLKEEDMKTARAKLHPPSLGRRYPEPSSVIDARHQEKTWTIVYDGLRFQVDVASGEVTRMADLPTGHGLEAAMARACRVVGELETKHPVLAGFSKARPEFLRNKTGLVRANLEFRNNAQPFSKAGTSPIDKAQPYCYLQVSVWRPNDLPGQPGHTQRRYVVNGIDYDAHVLAYSSDAELARKIQTVFEQEMDTINAAPSRR